MPRNKMAEALRDAEYDLDQAGERSTDLNERHRLQSLATDAWMLQRKLQRNPDYVPTRFERSELEDMDASGKLIDERPIRELAKRRDR